MNTQKEPKLHYLEYSYETKEGKKRNYIAAYNYQQSGDIFANEVLAKNNAEEIEAFVLVLSDERALEMGLTGYTKPGLIN